MSAKAFSSASQLSSSVGSSKPYAMHDGDSYSPKPPPVFNRKRVLEPIVTVSSGEATLHDYAKEQRVLDVYSNTERTQEVSTHMNRQMLNLARLRRDADMVKMQYQRLRMQELEMMRAIVEDECEETQVSLRQTERQIGQIRQQLYRSGGISACSTGQYLLNGRTSRAQASGFDGFSIASDTPDSSCSSPSEASVDEVN